MVLTGKPKSLVSIPFMERVSSRLQIVQTGLQIHVTTYSTGTEIILSDDKTA
jgi:hypothetical protein